MHLKGFDEILLYERYDPKDVVKAKVVENDLLVSLPILCSKNVFNIREYTHIIRGVGTGGARGPRPPQVFRRPQKCPFSGGKVPFAFVKNVVQIAFLFHGCCKAISVSLCSYLSVG